MVNNSKEEAGVDDRTAPEVGALRSLRVLEVLAGLEQPAGLPAIATAARLSRTKTYRSLRALEEGRYIDHIGHDGYRLGTRSVAFAALVGLRPALWRAAQPLLNRLAAFVDQTTSLHLRSGEHRVLVLGAEPGRTVRRGHAIIGERSPLSSGCSGTSILAFLPTPEYAACTKDASSRGRRRVDEQLEQIRSDGYALSFSDNHPHVNGIAAPLRDPSDGYPLGSIAIAGAEAELPEQALRQMARPLRATCKELAPQLARELGPNSAQRLTALDVTIQRLLDT